MASNTDANFKTDYEALSQVKVKEAWLMKAGPGGLIHSAWMFVTEDGRVLTFAGLPENEPNSFINMAKAAGPRLWQGVKSLFGQANFETTYDFGPIKAAMYETAPFATKENLPQAEKENPGVTFKVKDDNLDNAIRDQANYHKVVQGKGMAGLDKKGGVSLKRMDEQAGDAQLLFKSALTVNKLLDKTRINYDLLGTRGLNSHSVSSYVAQQADELSGSRLKGRFSKPYRKEMGVTFTPGMAGSHFFRGLSLAKVRDVVDYKENNPADRSLRWVKYARKAMPDNWQVHYRP